MAKGGDEMTDNVIIGLYLLCGVLWAAHGYIRNKDSIARHRRESFLSDEHEHLAEAIAFVLAVPLWPFGMIAHFLGKEP